MIIWICIGAIALVILNAVRTWPEVGSLLIASDNDDLMRLVEARDWLGGQGWFDTRQYRVLPPEGISMHWSRYVDAGIAAILVPASWLLPMQQAELLTVVVWPSLLACLMILLIGFGTNRLFGPVAALGALVVFLTWSKLRGEFTPPRIDHHGLQMLCATAAMFCAAVPGRAVMRGVLAGLATALSLAIGLEMLPVLALIPAWMALRHAYDQPQTGPWLTGFGIALGLGALGLFAGQTPVSDWATMRCDALAPPVLALAATGIVGTLVPVLLAYCLQGPLVRIATMGMLAALGLWLAAPILTPCMAGPYADVPPEVRTLIESRMVEALSAVEMFDVRPDILLRALIPAVVILVLALATTVAMWSRLQSAQRSALTLALLIALAGLAVSLHQVRAATLMVPALPVLTASLVHAFLQVPRNSVLRLPAFAALALATPTAVEEAGTYAARAVKPMPVSSAASPSDQVGPGNCRSETAMAELADLPRSTLFSNLNLGPAILAYTPHSVASAPYHRSPEAFWNGIAGLESDTNLRRALTASRADFVVLCAAEPPKPYARILLSGDLPIWLTEDTGDRSAVRLYRVDRALLATAP
ncbi:hypothetical protein [Rhodobacter sp. SY28-1]|uniref:hypothetical protein n=1 Tax=Rhodobacter sp. SY28-1 TaxID=2562317 RepID=UPI0010C094D0|nr:hypothetical protein [Rhodobacter sp. SY28-1]